MSESNMQLGLSQSLRSAVTQKFAEALASRNLIFSETHLAIIQNKLDAPFQLRYCPALSKKPTDNKPQTPQTPAQNQEPSPPKKKFDPFENPSEDLLVDRIPNTNNYTHNLVLNKYPVIPHHFILATRANKPQTNLLEHDDLSLTYACLQAWQDDSNNDQHRLYAFFNSGEHSGASQPHRHLQFLPIEDIKGTSAATTDAAPSQDTPSQSSAEWNLLCDRMATPFHPTLPLLYDPTLPILHLATPLFPSPTSPISPSDLYERYNLLLRTTSVLLASHNTSNINLSHLSQKLTPTSLSTATISTSTNSTTFSYNLCLTTSTMAILPRRVEDATIPDVVNQGNGTGVVSINGTILAGTLMVKNLDEWEWVRGRKGVLDDLLVQVGFPVGVETGDDGQGGKERDVARM